MSKTIASPSLPKRPRIHIGLNWRRAGFLVMFLVATGLFGFGGAWLQDEFQDDSITEQKRIVTSESRLISEIAKEVGPSVVSVNVSIETADPRSLFGLSGETAQAAGTGIIISDSGYIMTNRHVVPEGTTGVSVTLSDGTELEDVSVVGRTSTNDNLDIAFLKINDAEGKHLKAAAIGDSSKVLVGENVVAIGNALGQFQNTVTSGIISGYGRSVQAGSDEEGVENLNDLFQTDAAINEGNSGGPLVNMNGEVIGINTAVAGAGAENIGFAIPTNDVRGMVDQVLRDGKFTRPYLGVRYIPLTADIAKEYDVKVEQGAFILPSDDTFNSSVLPDGPAAKAGLKERDVIVSINGKKVDQRHSLTSLLGVYEPGDTVRVEVQRGDETRNFTIKLGSLPTQS